MQIKIDAFVAASSATTNQKLSQVKSSLTCVCVEYNNCAGMVIGDLRLVYLILGWMEAAVIIALRFLE